MREKPIFFVFFVFLGKNEKEKENKRGIVDDR